MKYTALLMVALLANQLPACFGSVFTIRSPDNDYGRGIHTWDFDSSLSQDAAGVIEFVYREDGTTERIMGSVAIYPFVSSRAVGGKAGATPVTARNFDVPPLRILAAHASDGKNLVLVAGYGLRTGVFVVRIDDLAGPAVQAIRTPKATANGEHLLLGFGGSPTHVVFDRIDGVIGRLYLRFRGTR